jgi:hypothetical protein
MTTMSKTTASSLSIFKEALTSLSSRSNHPIPFVQSRGLVSLRNSTVAVSFIQELPMFGSSFCIRPVDPFYRKVAKPEIFAQILSDNIGKFN